MPGKEFIDKFLILFQNDQEEIPTNVTAGILRDYSEGLD
tara:strand:+ start:192 stop:308 length:117 start_codon:yes stop_codon:yes gene_type:complete